MIYNKLVRDKIPRIIKENGKNPVTHIANDEEYKRKLKEKLKEEVDEFLENNDVNEMIDIFEVMMAINGLNGWDFQKILDQREQKRQERGAFDKKIILERVD